MKGLKPGDTFADGSLTYKVIEVLEDGNYISKRVDAVSEEVTVSAEDEPPKRRTRKKSVEA